jgi:hypothetical protein
MTISTAPQTANPHCFACADGEAIHAFPAALCGVCYQTWEENRRRMNDEKTSDRIASLILKAEAVSATPLGIALLIRAPKNPVDSHEVEIINLAELRAFASSYLTR